MAGKLDGKTAVVTGASSGIGEATAIALAQEGAAVALVARRAERLDALQKRIESSGGRAVSIVADVADEKQAQDMIAQAQAQLGRLDILVNNAGVMLLGPIEGTDIADWKRMLDTNVWGLMVATHAALPIMKAQGGGHVVLVSSVAGRGVSPISAVYAATKHAVGAFGEGLRKQESKNKIRMTLIEPGAVATELLEHTVHPETKQMMTEWVGSMNALQSEDIAASIVYAVTQPPHVNVNEILIRPGRAGELTRFTTDCRRKQPFRTDSGKGCLRHETSEITLLNRVERRAVYLQSPPLCRIILVPKRSKITKRSAVRKRYSNVASIG